MTELHPITVAALEALKLDTDRVPKRRQELQWLAANRTPITEWTWEQSAAYRHLWELIGQGGAIAHKTDTPESVCQLA